jgi:hypothetical protein
MNNNCCYCNSPSYGKGCQRNPDGTGRHVHPNDPSTCRFCNSASYGKGCQLNDPTGLHVHGQGGSKCVFCGSSSVGSSGCQLNPFGLHESVGSNVIEGAPGRVAYSEPTPYTGNSSPTNSSSSDDDAFKLIQHSGMLFKDNCSIRERCKYIFKDNLPWGYQVIASIPVLYLGLCLVWNLFKQQVSPSMGVCAALVFGLVYLFRNISARILYRSYIGIPALGFAYFAAQFIDPAYRWIPYVSALGIWLWPLWPLAAILVMAFAAAAPGLAALGGAKTYNK